MPIPRHVMPVGLVAELAGVTTQAVRDHDDELRPILGRQGYRYYDPAIVAAWLEKRAGRAK